MRYIGDASVPLDAYDVARDIADILEGQPEVTSARVTKVDKGYPGYDRATILVVTPAVSFTMEICAVITS